MNNSYIANAFELNFAAGQLLISNGLKICVERSLTVSIAIVDRAGLLLAFARMDNAAPVTISVAQGKARTATLLRAPSKKFEDMTNSGMTSLVTIPDLMPLQGGMPIFANGYFVGAVGVSGSSGENDQIVAELVARSIDDNK